MAKKYIAGDVVQCRFPIQENPAKFTPRPGLILKIEMVGTTPFFITAKITSTDNSHYIVGKFIKANSKEGKSMRLDNDSFIHLENIAKLPLNAILRFRGVCPILDELKEMCSKNNIAI
jgi:hypothetical protein